VFHTKAGKPHKRNLSSDTEEREHLIHIFNYFENIAILVEQKRIHFDEAVDYKYWICLWWDTYSEIIDYLRDKWDQKDAWSRWQILAEKMESIE
jgi:hypothetical protein